MSWHDESGTDKVSKAVAAVSQRPTPLSAPVPMLDVRAMLDVGDLPVLPRPLMGPRLGSADDFPTMPMEDEPREL